MKTEAPQPSEIKALKLTHDAFKVESLDIC